MRSFVLLLFVALVLSSAQPAYSFDIDEIRDFFRKKHQQTVQVVNHVGCPVIIDDARVEERGSEHFRSFTGILDTYSIKVRNVSGRDVLAYKIAWTLKHPFQNWVFRRITANSIDEMHPGEVQTLSFKRDKHYRQDAYYYAEIEKVQFADESIWEAPDYDETMTVDDILESEIKAMEEKSIDDMSLEDIKKILPAANGTNLNSESTKPVVEEEVPAKELELETK